MEIQAQLIWFKEYFILLSYVGYESQRITKVINNNLKFLDN